MKILVSACLLGCRCRYDGTGCTEVEAVKKLMEKYTLIPVCPEQLGGLPTPREPAELKNGKVVNKKGKDVTAQFQKGAVETVGIAKLCGCSHAILKERSPSCGSSYIYDGNFDGTRIRGQGLTARLLRENDIVVMNEDEIEQIIIEEINK